MIADHISVSTSQWSEERALTVHLVLTTLAGDEAQLTIEIQEFDRLQEFENAVVEQLPVTGESSTFGCELSFVCRNSQQKLVDPIWHTLRDCNCFFFPRVRTPCGHGAQVIVEGREEKTDGGERNEDPKKQPKNQTPKPAGRLHHLVVFPIH